MDKEELTALLKANHVPFDTWGTGEAKTFEHLWKEINEGESVLIERDNMLLRIANGSTLRVYYKKDSTLLYLKEDRQVFKDGREKKRNLAENMSIGEKLKHGEIPAVCAWRSLAEELGITEKLPLTPRPDITRGPVPSVSFPGLHTMYTMYAFDVFLPERWFRPEGYVEKQPDKTSYFIWKEFTEE